MKTSIRLFIIIISLQISALPQELKDPFETHKQFLMRPLQTKQNSFAKTEAVKPPLGHYQDRDWEQAMEDEWGEGLPLNIKIDLLTSFYQRIDAEYPAFFNLDIDWSGLYNKYFNEIFVGANRGRFFGMISQMNLALLDDHTALIDVAVALDTLEFGLPLLMPNGYWNCAHFGAGLTPLPDSTLLVYKVVPDHPLGLKVGDIILGYDGTLWKDLYKELLAEELPIAFTACRGSSIESNTFLWLASAGMNWHLFDTIDVLKYESNQIEHLSTQPLQTPITDYFFCTYQMPIPGVPFPDILNEAPWISWGKIEGTQIMYVKVYYWGRDEFDEFEKACLHATNDPDCRGLIIDSRVNFGGDIGYFRGLAKLFNGDLGMGGFYERDNPSDHFSMKPERGWEEFKFKADQTQLFDRPLAILTGPASYSAGDYMPLQTRYHPMAKTFGLPSSSAFGTNSWNSVPQSEEWSLRLTPSVFYHTGEPEGYIIHIPPPVDERVWLTQEDVVKGEDTVVNAAISWINSLTYTHDVDLVSSWVRPNIDSVFVLAKLENPQNNDVTVSATLVDKDTLLVGETVLHDDGNHHDGEANDNFYGGSFPPVLNSGVFSISVKTLDLTDGTERELPNVKRFTTSGPIVLNDFSLVAEDTLFYPGDSLEVNLSILNKSAIDSFTNVTGNLFCLDSLISVETDTLEFGDMLPAQTEGNEKNLKVCIDQLHPGDIHAQLIVKIATEGFYFWKDTLSFYIQPTTVSIENREMQIPDQCVLHDNYPNPFNPSTTISYDLDKAGNVELAIYNIIGQKIATLVNKQQLAGQHQVIWDGNDGNGNMVSSGIYLYKLKTEKFSQTKKMMYLQ